MPIVQRFKTQTPRLTPMRLSLITAAIVAVACLALTARQPADMIPAAKAGEARMSMQGESSGASKKSWSEEWYEVHKAIPASFAAAIPTF
jgi:hypothetical protein